MAAPIRQKNPIRLHCPVKGDRPRCFEQGAALARGRVIAAISQASMHSPAPHEDLIDRLLIGMGDEILRGQRKSPQQTPAGSNKEPVTFRVCLGNG